jgi:AbrB family looped-hinge helix DNA binding protein
MNYYDTILVIHLRLLAMKSTITARGQTVIPAEIRQRFHLSPSDRLEWVVDGASIRVIPVKSDPIEAFRGRGKGGSVARLLSERAQDRNRE